MFSDIDLNESSDHINIPKEERNLQCDENNTIVPKRKCEFYLVVLVILMVSSVVGIIITIAATAAYQKRESHLRDEKIASVTEQIKLMTMLIRAYHIPNINENFIMNIPV